MLPLKDPEIRNWWYSIPKKDRPAKVKTLDVVQNALGVARKDVTIAHMRQAQHALARMGFDPVHEIAYEYNIEHIAEKRLLENDVDDGLVCTRFTYNDRLFIGGMYMPVTEVESGN